MLKQSAKRSSARSARALSRDGNATALHHPVGSGLSSMGSIGTGE
jgi:hypothetical protein